MDPDRAIEIGQEAIMACLTLAAPFLLVGIVVAIVLGIIQSMTHTQDQTVSFVPKIILLGLTFIICLPWFSDRIVDYSRDWLESPRLMSIPNRVSSDPAENRSQYESVAGFEDPQQSDRR